MSGNIKDLLRTHKYAILLVVIVLATHVQWFNPWSLLESGDWQFRFDEHVRQLFGSWGTWLSFDSIGTPNIQLFSYPLRGFVWPLLASLGLSYDMITKITLFIPIALGGSLIPYFVGRTLLKNDFIAFTGALFYSTTTYFLLMQTRHLLIAIVYAAMPLFFYLAYKLHIKNRMYDWVTAAVLLSVGIFYELRIMYVVFGLLALYFMFAAAFRDLPKIKRYARPLAIAGGLMLLLNAFWIIPTALGAGDAIAKTANRGLFGNDLFHLDQAFTIFRWSWTGGYEDRSFIVQPIQWYLWLPPLIAFSALVYRTRYKKQLCFFAVVALIGLFLTKQSSPPFSASYLWLYEHVPGFNLFREASKFYVITAFGYWGLIMYGLLALKESSFKFRYASYAAIASVVIAVACVNLKPLLTREMGATFVNTQLPADYVKLKDYLVAQPEHYRTLWVPLAATWTYYDKTHPKITTVLDLNKPSWGFLGAEKQQFIPNEEHAMAPLKQPLADFLLDSTSVKYVVVPIRYTFHYDDQFIDYGGRENPQIRDWYIAELDGLPFLKRVDLGLSELVVYENSAYRPYIHAVDTVYDLGEGPVQRLPEMARFLGAATNGGPLNFVGEQGGAGPLRAAYDIFEDLKTGNQANGALAKTVDVPRPAALYANINNPAVSYEIQGGELTFFVQPEHIVQANGEREFSVKVPEQKSVLGKYSVDRDVPYILGLGDTLVPVKPEDGTRDLGVPKASISLFKAGKDNLIKNPSFENGLWQRGAEKCLPDNTATRLDPTLDETEKTDGATSLSLNSVGNVACTRQTVRAEGGKQYGLAFDYKVVGGKRAGYEIIFNDDKNTTIRQSLAAPDESWRQVSRMVTAPRGANELTLRLFGFGGEEATFVASTLYDHVSLTPIERVAFMPLNTKQHYEKVELKEPGRYTFRYDNPAVNYANLVPNPSLESGPWQKKVGDCNAFDNQPLLNMDVSQKHKTDGAQSLMLEARRHTACTGPAPMKVSELRHYLLQFDYHSPNAMQAGYYLSFNDPARTTLYERLPIENNEWHTFSKPVEAPLGATEARLMVYAYSEKAAAQAMVNHYDNFFFGETPHVQGTYYVLADAPETLKKPERITYDIVSGSKKRIHIKGASTPFFLSMSEAYHKQWRLMLDNAGVRGAVNSWAPWVKPNLNPAANHFMLNEFANGWYIDPAALCRDRPQGCTVREDDSYDLELVTEFAPQRLFYLGGFISGVAALGVGGYLVLKRRQGARR